MPTTDFYFPILSRFFCRVEKSTGEPVMPVDTEKKQEREWDPSKLPKGVVLGPDGKPCRSCTSSASWKTMMKKAVLPPSQTPPTTPPVTVASQQDAPSDCPPDVEKLGQSSWTLLHAMAGAYPERPTADQQKDASQFISSFSRLYPCHWCGTDFQQWMKEARNAPRVSSRQEFGQWMCEAHNEVNQKLGKDLFDCNKWEERWRTGWKDGRCD